MDGHVRAILSAIENNDDWVAILYEGFLWDEYVLWEKIVPAVIRKGFPASILQKLFYIYNERTGLSCAVFLRAWVRTIAGYGNKEVFKFLLENIDLRRDVGEIYESAFHTGEKRLTQVLKWIKELANGQDVLASYIAQVETSDSSLSDTQKSIIIKGSQSLGLNPFTHPWGSKDGLVRKWLLTVRDDV